MVVTSLHAISLDCIQEIWREDKLKNQLSRPLNVNLSIYLCLIQEVETESQAVIGPAVVAVMKMMMLHCIPPHTLHSRLSGNGEPWLTPSLTREPTPLLVLPLCFKTHIMDENLK